MRFVRTAENLFSIPQGFTRVEYLESIGTQYIDTGVLPVNDMEFECKFTFISLVSTNLTIVGSRDGEKRCQPIGVYNNKWSASIGGAYDANGKSVSSGTPYTINATITNGQTITTNVNGSQASTCTSTTGLPSQELYIFARNFYVNTDSKVNGRLYFLKIKANGALVRDFIPCIDPLGVPCMYDLVGKKPYYNQGTGTFTAGRQVIPVDYLESTGTQYIDTGVDGDLTTELTCEAAIVQAGNASVTNIMGNNVTSSRAITINMSANITNPSPSRIRFGNTDNTTEAGAINLNTFYKYDTNKNELTVRDVGGAVLNTYPLNATTAFTTNGNILIYKLGDTSTQYIGKIKVKGATIKNNGVLVRDFIPCKDENNVGFMFDTLSGTVYLNAGTGAFSVGEPVYTSKLRLIKDAIRLPSGYTRVEYLESSGTQYIDTGYIPTNTTGVQVRHTICADNSKDNIVFGCREGSRDTRFWEDIDWTNSDTIGWGFNSYSSTTAGTRFPISGMAGQTIVSSMNFMNDRAGRVNGVPYDTSLETKTLITITRPICLFAANYAGTMSLFTACKIFSCQISEGSTLVRSFIPVRDENNVGYMFDEVTGQIFGNAGSGSFGIGNDLPTAKVRFIQDVIPSDYLPLKYLQSTGTQYIDLGVGVKSNTVFKATFSVASTATGRSYFGARNSTNERFQIVNSIGIGGGYYLGNTVYPIANQKYEIEMHANGDMYLDGVKRNASNGTFSQVAFERNLWLFATNYYDSSVGPGASTFWSAIIYEGGIPVRDLYPALRKSDNKPGMYDRITKQFFTNASQSGNDFNYE